MSNIWSMVELMLTMTTFCIRVVLQANTRKAARCMSSYLVRRTISRMEVLTWTAIRIRQSMYQLWIRSISFPDA